MDPEKSFVFFYHFLKNYSLLLLGKTNVIHTFNMDDFFNFLVLSRSTEILV